MTETYNVVLEYKDALFLAKLLYRCMPEYKAEEASRAARIYENFGQIEKLHCLKLQNDFNDKRHQPKGMF